VRRQIEHKFAARQIPTTISVEPHYIEEFLLRPPAVTCTGTSRASATPEQIDRTCPGDAMLSPDAGKVNKGREDDDDDDSVGFRRSSGHASLSRWQFWCRSRSTAPLDIDYPLCYACGVTPKYSVPKRDPVATTERRPPRPLNDCSLHYACSVIPKYGPPKRDPVAATERRPPRPSIDEKTIAIWRHAITRVCGNGNG
jgi:hypothetical protein